MRIDHFASKPDRAGRYLIRFSDGSTMRLYRQTVEDFGLYAGLELSEDQMVALRANAGDVSAKMRAVRIVSASSVEKDFGMTGGNKAAARKVGELVAKRALEKGVECVVFDRGGYIYHGRVQELAEGAREGGLKF